MGRKRKVPPPAFATGGTWHTHYIVLFDDLLNSPAYIALSSAAKETYTILMQEYKGNYTGPDIICPYKTFISKGMRANTVSRAISELEAFGFISCDHGGLQHQPNVYHLADKWKAISKEDVKTIKQLIKEKRELALKAKENLSPSDSIQ